MSGRMNISHAEYCDMLVSVADLIWQCSASGTSRRRWGIRRKENELSLGAMSDLWQMVYTLEEIYALAGENCEIVGPENVLISYCILQSKDSKNGKVSIDIIPRSNDTVLKLGPQIRKH